MKVDYYKQVVAVTQEYLGPAAERFIRRQIEFHSDKDPLKINKQDVIKLRESVRVSLSLLLEDKRIVNEAVRKFDAIVKK